MLPHITAAIIDNWKSFHMLKRLCLALAGLFAFVAAANGAGTVPGFSLTPQFDLTGKVAPGCKLYIIQAGTVSTPQNGYQDTGLTQVLPNPLTCDAGGRLPQWFVADGTIKLRLTTSAGTQIFVGDNLLVVGPSSGGGGGGGTVDPTTILATGDMKTVYDTGVLSGFVRCNGRTIGSATSGATERANADTQALFVHFWGVDSSLAVSGGRGASGAADFAANKTLTLPDCRGRVVAGLDDMGNSAAGRLTSSYFGGGLLSGTVLGNAAGGESATLTLAQLPTGITASGSNSITVQPSNGIGVITYAGGGFVGSLGGGGTSGGFANPANIGLASVNLTGNNSISVTSNNTSGQAHRTVQPTILMTIYIKL